MTQPSVDQLPSQPRTIKRGGGRVWIHPMPTHGRFSRLRLVTSCLLLLLLYATPWLRIDGQPFLRLSFFDTSFVMFGSHILIYEFYHFVLMTLLLVFTLFLASALYGRVWCGYACPQTVFVEQIFGRIETFFEGSATRRLAAEGKPLTLERVARKAAKQLAFVIVSASFGFTFVAIFTGPETILAGDGGALGAVAFLTALAWFDGAYWREQFCHIVCPYGRFQGVMQDRATRTIGYDLNRGEPRRRGKDRDGAGDCIDCGLCVRVCPSGIDIRHGAHQLECIGCAKCIDACDGIMESLHKPSGLIRYDAVAMFSTVKPGKRPSIVRPRLFVYAGLWLGIFGVGLYQYVNRAAFHAKVLSTRGADPYVIDGPGVNNLFTVKIANQWRGDESYSLTVSLADGAPADQLLASGLRLEIPVRLGPVAPGTESVFPVLMRAPRGLVGREVELTLTGESSGAVRILRRHIIGPAH